MDAEPMLRPEISPVPVIRNAITAVAAALLPGAVVRLPVLGAMLLPCALPNLPLLLSALWLLPGSG